MQIEKNNNNRKNKSIDTSEAMKAWKLEDRQIWVSAIESSASIKLKRFRSAAVHQKRSEKEVDKKDRDV